MELISDALLIAGALGAAAYCHILSKRLNALRNLDSGLGAAIAALSRQVDEMKQTFDAARSFTDEQERELRQLTGRAEMAAGRLEMMLASLHENGQSRPVEHGARRRAAELGDGDAGVDPVVANADAIAQLRAAEEALRRRMEGSR